MGLNGSALLHTTLVGNTESPKPARGCDILTLSFAGGWDGSCGLGRSGLFTVLYSAELAVLHQALSC